MVRQSHCIQFEFPIRETIERGYVWWWTHNVTIKQGHLHSIYTHCTCPAFMLAFLSILYCIFASAFDLSKGEGWQTRGTSNSILFYANLLRTEVIRLMNNRVLTAKCKLQTTSTCIILHNKPNLGNIKSMHCVNKHEQLVYITCTYIMYMWSSEWNVINSSTHPPPLLFFLFSLLIYK